MKPRIRKIEDVIHGGFYWMCAGGGKAGWGKTPLQAYVSLIQELILYALTVIPRNRKP